MRFKLAGILGVWLLACATLVAADFWEEKDFATWSDKEVAKMLTNSPWAKKVTIVMGNLQAAPSGGFTGGAAGPGGDDCGGGEQFQGVRRAEVWVIWNSALPVKQALARRQTGVDGPIPPDLQEQLTQDEPFYSVTLTGLPPSFATLGSMVDALKAETMLKRKNKEPIAPESIRLFKDADETIRMVALFPKTDAITLDDKDVEFITKLVTIDLKKKFKLADMVFGDQLEL